MATLNERGKAHEIKFALEEERAFRVHAQLLKLVGLNIAEKLGLKGDAATQYARDVIMADFDAASDEEVLEKLIKDTSTAGVVLKLADLHRMMDDLHPAAYAQATGHAMSA